MWRANFRQLSGNEAMFSIPSLSRDAAIISHRGQPCALHVETLESVLRQSFARPDGTSDAHLSRSCWMIFVRLPGKLDFSRISLAAFTLGSFRADGSRDPYEQAFGAPELRLVLPLFLFEFIPVIGSSFPTSSMTV